MKVYYRQVQVDPGDTEMLYHMADQLEPFASRYGDHAAHTDECGICAAKDALTARVVALRKIAYRLETQVPVLMVEDDDASEVKGDSDAT